MSEKQSRCLNPLPRSYSSQKSSGSPHSSVGFVSVAEARGLCSFLPQLTALKKIIVNTPVVLIPIMNSKYLDLYHLLCYYDLVLILIYFKISLVV
ncbi:hypothetical protein KY290_024403 [Solanum tuberosum]|uniref:Uncharacterized protein n=1 Tax=Solanum tuberosum TaxID=4113 RepID=A0ABQ7USL8_SOLTU|nr:hypothetical protein KY290_024403 [Solanum tuberosum]